MKKSMKNLILALGVLTVASTALATTTKKSTTKKPVSTKKVKTTKKADSSVKEEDIKAVEEAATDTNQGLPSQEKEQSPTTEQSGELTKPNNTKTQVIPPVNNNKNQLNQSGQSGLTTQPTDTDKELSNPRR